MGDAVLYFDVWQPGYAGASVAIYAAGTSTLLPAFLDQALTIPAANPQSLLSMQQNGQNFGKFANPIYVGAPYQLSINGSNRTGVVTPAITEFAGEDVSQSTVLPTGAVQANALADIVARTVNVLDYGEFLPTSNPGASASTNNATLLAAIGAASALGGGTVTVPPGTYIFTQITLPARVLLRGNGRDVTTLQSQVGGNVVTYAGQGCGMWDITIDGVILSANSVGVYSKATNETRFNNVHLMRFQVGLFTQGGHRADWRDLFLDNCNSGGYLSGDSDASGGGGGDEWKFNEWNGGRVTNCTQFGVAMGFIDMDCWHNSINDVGFENNPAAIALQIKGARFTDFRGCWWLDNLTDLNVLDGDDPTKISQNSVIGLHFSGFVINDNMDFTGTGQDIVFERGEFAGGTYTLSALENNIIIKDCTEANAVQLAGGDATQWMRQRTELGDWPNSEGVTTGATPTEAWAYQLAPGETVFLEAKIIAKGRNVIDYATFHISQGAQRPGSTLMYDGRTATFTDGAILTGATSGATAQITNDTNGVGVGTLTLVNIIGAFIDDENISDSSGGAAIANGVLAAQNAALLGAITSISAAVKSDASWACVFSVTPGQVVVTVTGAANKTIQWTPAVQVTSSG